MGGGERKEWIQEQTDTGEKEGSGFSVNEQIYFRTAGADKKLTQDFFLFTSKPQRKAELAKYLLTASPFNISHTHTRARVLARTRGDNPTSKQRSRVEGVCL